MTAKEYLCQYRRLTERIRQINLDIEKLSAEIDSVSISYDGMPKGSAISNRTERMAVKLTSRREDLLRCKEEAWEKREEIQQVIDSVSKAAYSRVLYDRYILCWTWPQIAADMGKDIKHVSGYIHGRALQDVCRIISAG